jgi:hypothetical protein
MSEEFFEERHDFLISTSNAPFTPIELPVGRSMKNPERLGPAAQIQAQLHIRYTVYSLSREVR